MAKDEQVRIDIVAKDDASKQLDKIADKVDDLEHADVEIPVEADTEKAERSVDDLLDMVGRLADEPAQLLLSSNAAAIGDDIIDLTTKLNKLDATDPEVSVTIDKINALQGDLDKVEGKLRETGDIAGHTARQLDKVGGGGEGIKTRGNAISDLTGPLGDASSAASDFAGVFDGLGDIAEDVVGKLGLSEGAAAAVSSAVGGLGIAVAAGAAVWSLWSARAKKAAEDQKKLIENQKKLNEAISGGDIDKSSQAFVDGYGKILDAATAVGGNIAELTQFITGQSTSLAAWGNNIDATNKSLADGSIEQTVYTANVKKARGEVEAARKKYQEANGSLDDQQSKLAQVSSAMQNVVDTSGELTQAYADAADPATALTRAQTDIADATDRVNTLLHEQADALNAQVDAALAAADSTIAAADAQQDFIDAANKTAAAAKLAAEAQKKHGKNSKEAADAAADVADAVKSERDAMIKAAQQAQRLAADQASASGKTLTARERLEKFNDSLMDNARFATPAARSAIADYINTANRVPASKSTAIKAAIERGDFATAEALLKSVSRTRTAAIQADADTAAAEHDLDNTANPNGQPRVANVRLALINPNFSPQLGPIGGPRSLPPAEGAAPPVAVPMTTSVVNVTQHLPRGFNGDALAAAERAARRSGGLYRRSRR